MPRGNLGKHSTCHHKLYDLTCDAFEELRALAEERCQICGLPEANTKPGYLYIDHDGRRGNGYDHVRGLLCTTCNCALRYVDSSFREPTPEQARYLEDAWFWTHHPSPTPPRTSSATTTYVWRAARLTPVEPMASVTARIPARHHELFKQAVGMIGRSQSQVLDDLIRWYLRKPGAKLPRRPECPEPPRAADATDAQTDPQSPR